MPSSFAPRHNNTQKRRRTPLGRSSSLLGAIKNIVTAPLSWFGNPDESGNVDGKRRLSSKSSEDEEDSHGEEEDDHRSNKRQRRYSPEPSSPSEQQTAGYLDPNLDGFVQQHPAYSGHSSSSLAVPSSSRQQQRQARRSHSPYPTTSYAIANGVFRTQSMDPPNRRAGSYELSLTPGALSRDASMEAPPSSSPIQEDGFSPSRTRFRMRTSLTPQPHQVFGPAYARRERDTSEPPPLTSLSSQPVFVKAPSGSQGRSLSREPSVTLGTIAEQRRSSATLSKQHRSLQIAEKTSSDQASDVNIATGAHYPINAAEKALRELDAYRTPLLPSRFKGSSTIPDMFKLKRTHPPVLMRGDRDERPRLGMSEKPGAKRKAKDDGKSTKPYSGQGGMKKLLARRRKEEEEEKREAAAAEAEEESVSSPTKVVEEEEIKEPDPIVFNPPPEEEAPPARAGGRGQSSLRIGRTRTSRNHAPAIQSRSRNRFSAVYEDDGDDQMGEEGKAEASTQTVDSAPIPQLFKPPVGFSFANNVSTDFDVGIANTYEIHQTTPIQQDASTAKEPPIAALPFSITAAATTTAPAVALTTESTQPQAPSPKPAPAPALAPSRPFQNS
ncbi:hypothetical protein NLI96_g7180 [Meripilus lineatus]|uniref:Uncharacterized protein n=1 Tax=Meripilus lineatus TaxID=2056292 RepID=A0AAD5UZN3_9APHY|nr:hypothetical protein NLI96_g7180 [Physisporinus lineatus]